MALQKEGLSYVDNLTNQSARLIFKQLHKIKIMPF
jgi:hypothetical protein